MIIYLGSDHGGVALKKKLVEVLTADGYNVADLGAFGNDPADDYPNFAKLVGGKVSAAPDDSRGILICRSGFGMDIVANKFPGVRAGLPISPDHIYQGRHDDDINVLCLAGDFVDEAAALNITKVFLSTPFAREERYTRRLQEIAQIEIDNNG